MQARHAGKGREAVEKLQKEGLDPKFLHLDVCSIESINAAKKEVEDTYGRLDVLVHCAGIILPVRIHDYYGLIQYFYSRLTHAERRGVYFSLQSQSFSYHNLLWNTQHHKSLSPTTSASCQVRFTLVNMITFIGVHICRVVSLGSENGNLLEILSIDMQKVFTSPNLTIKKLSQLMDQYMRYAKASPCY